MEQEAGVTRVACPNCGTVYRINKPADQLVGVKLRCKKCDLAFSYQALAAQAPAAAVPPPAPDPSPAAAAPPPAPAAAPAATPPPAAAPPAASANGDAFAGLEEHFGELNREIYQLRQKSPDLIPEKVSSEVSALGDKIVEAKRQLSSFRRASESMESLLEVSNALNQVHDLGELLELVMDYAIKTLGAERGFLMLKNMGTGALEVSVARGMGEALSDEESKEFSTGIASRVASGNTPYFTANSHGDADVAGFASVMRSDARAIVCVPVNYQDENLGTLYIDNRTGAAGFTRDLLRMASAFASSAAGAIQNARLYEDIEEETQKRANLSRYLSPAIVDDILSKGDDLGLGSSSTVECSVLFSDVAGFTSFSEKLTPDELIKLLNEYFTSMADVIFSNYGTLDKFIGDATMAVFGTPVYDPQHAAWAVKAGLEMIKACNELMERWTAEGKPTFQMRVGVNSGPVVAGNLGSPQRMDYTVIGDTVNLAQRMESNSEIGGVAVSGFTWERIKDTAEGTARGPIKVKGKSDEIPVYQVTAITPPDREAGQVKRSAPRVDSELFAIYSQEGQTGTRQGIIRNISMGGLSLQSSFAADAGNTLRLNCSLLPSGEVKDLSSRVVRVITGDEGGYTINLQFAEPSEENLKVISDYISTHL